MTPGFLPPRPRPPLTSSFLRGGPPSVLRRQSSLFIAYETAERPLCGLCGVATHKRAVFFQTKKRRPLCAVCAVGLFVIRARDPETRRAVAPPR